MQAMENNLTRLAYLSYDGLTDPLGQSQILPYVLGLEAKGFEFAIISFEKPEAFAEERATIEARIAGKKVKWIPLKYHKKPLVLSTLLDSYNLWKALMREHKKSPIHIVHCRSYITALIGQRMKRQAGTKFIFDMRGFWADERVEGGLWNLNNPLYRLIYNFFTWMYKLVFSSILYLNSKISLNRFFENAMRKFFIKKNKRCFSKRQYFRHKFLQ